MKSMSFTIHRNVTLDQEFLSPGNCTGVFGWHDCYAAQKTQTLHKEVSFFSQLFWN